MQPFWNNDSRNDDEDWQTRLFGIKLLIEFQFVSLALTNGCDHHGEPESFHISDGQFADVVNRVSALDDLSHLHLAVLSSQVAGRDRDQRFNGHW